ncbi:intersectin-2 isoform X2 [Planococcus citri]|uniref:intersectin-2 isoform X2 n=1 Tax=Planococcus citri TaxID=170843 RepID=UPI0031F79329
MENWSVTPEEKKVFEGQFHSLKPVDGNITGENAKGFFVQSGLAPNILAFIWELSDVTRDGQLNINEFTAACKLIQMKLRGYNVPPQLPLPLLNLVKGEATPPVPVPVPVSAISPPLSGHQSPLVAAIPASQSLINGIPPSQAPLLMGGIPAPIPGPARPIPAAVGMPLGGVPMASAAVGIPPPPANIPPPNTLPTSPILIPGAASPPSGATHQTVPGSAAETPVSCSPSSTYEWSVPYNTKLKYTQMFNQADSSRSGYLTGVQARGIMVLTQLPIEMLAKIWTLADIDGDGQLTCEEFVLAMYLCDQAKAGKEIKSPLPPELMPPTFVKKTRQNSVSSTGSAENANATVTSPQANFEDKRKENFEKGQAELERRRLALLEIQRQEKENRERIEREEAERKEKIRLEQEKRQQEEMEKQLQIQREIEREKEKERQKAFEQREAARKEMEKQRYLEWEKQRIQDLENHYKKELEFINSMRERYANLNAEYQSLNDKVRELSLQTGETRNGVNAVKTTIDGMRANRDTLLSDMTSLKNQLKEQNQRLITLNQEKASLEAKKHSAQSAADSKTQEQLKFDVVNQQIVVNQLQEEVKEVEADLESRKVDYNNNVTELTELKGNTAEMIKTCEALYSEYCDRKDKVLELKSSKLKDVSSWGDAAWNSNDAWGSEPEAVSAVSASAGVGGAKKYRALYEFVARNADELSFQPGDIITASESQSAEPGWLAGELQGRSGWFPESYVQIFDGSGGEDGDTANIEPVGYTNGDPSLEDIAEVPENISDNGSALEEGFGPAVSGEGPVDKDVGTAVNVTAQALYSWKARNDSQISFNKGDMVLVSRQQDNWYYGDVQGFAGWFPVSYVKEVAATTAAEESEEESYYTAIYPYQSTEPDDLCFEQNDLIKVIKKDGDWWTGVLNGRTGVFPSNYVQKADYSAPAPVTQRQPPALSPVTDNNASQIPRCASAPPTQLENQYSVMMDRAMTPDFSTLSSSEVPKGKKPELATVIAPYQATSKEQLSLHRGQLIMVRKKTDSGWWEGETHVKGRKRQIGWFPASYVKSIGGGMTSPSKTDLFRKQSVQSVQSESSSPVFEKVIALYKYTALNPDELSFDKDDVIKMIAKEEPDWWKGELNGKVGLFPSNYVQTL